MIRNLVHLGCLWLLIGVAWAQAPEPVEPAEFVEPAIRPADTSIQQHRTPLEALTERAIGRTSRRVRYDWRRGMMQVGMLGSLPAELNNFDALRAGGFVRLPGDTFLWELGLSYVWVRGSESSEQLALTPYRQSGRPSRMELSFAMAYPLAEGVVTVAPAFMPSVELVFNALAEVRYLIYPHGYAGLGFKDVLSSLIAPGFSDDELANLDDNRLPGMQVDPGRYGTLLGLGNDVYFQSGFFFGFKALVAVPLLVLMNDSELGFGFELNITAGLAF
jgi:hypothetical protein